MIEKTVLRKSKTISLQNAKNIELSIQLSLDGFSFCALNKEDTEQCIFKEYRFDSSVNTPEELLTKIDAIFKAEPNLQFEFQNVHVIHQNNLSTIVPDTFFDEENLANYLKYNIKTLKNDFITYDDIAEIGAKNVYIPYVNINNYLFQNFGEFDYEHHSSVLLRKIIKENHLEDKTMYVNVTKNCLDITILKGKALILFNSFTYQTKEDFIYYILFTAEQQQLNPEVFSLYFTGDINIESQTYKITYDYIKNIDFLQRGNSIYNSLDLPKHTNYILLG